MAKLQKKQKIEKNNCGILTLATIYRLKAETGFAALLYGSSIYQTGRYMILFLYRDNRDDFLKEQSLETGTYRFYKTSLNSDYFPFFLLMRKDDLVFNNLDKLFFGEKLFQNYLRFYYVFRILYA